MSLFTLSAGRRPAVRPLHAIADALVALSHEWVLWRARQALGRLNDEALHDIGMGRGHIGTAVRHGRGALRT